MLDQIKEFFSNNTIMVVFAAVALLAIVGMFMFKPKSTMQQGPNGMPENTINNMMGGCDINTGMCYPQNDQMGQPQQMTPEMQDQMMQDQMMEEQMMQEQMMQEQMQQQEDHHMMQEQQMMEEQEMTPEMLQMIQAQ